MSVTVSLKHATTYEYSEPVQMSPQIIRLRPAPHTRTPIKGYSLKVGPKEHFINWQQDPFGNHLARIVFTEPIERFAVEVNLIAELVAVNPFDFFLEPHAEEVPFAYSETLLTELAPYLVSPEGWTEQLEDWKQTCIPNGERSVDYMLRLTQQISKTVEYEIRYEPGVQSAAATLERGAGSCRDSAWLLVEILRSLGFAARFVSGYLVQLVPDVKPIDGPAGPEEDFTDLHAWAEVYLPGAGWVGLDPTSGLAAGEGHIPLVATPSPDSAAPVTGSSSETAVSFSYTNQVDRIEDAPRSTKPYREKQWQQILEIGEQVDKTMAAQGLKLTMGGEPTFVSAEDLEGEEWNTEADGSDKREKANQLARKLRDRFAAGGVIQYGQGKWYPGEPLPRWEIGLSWRKDGRALWKNPDLLANPAEPLDHDCSTAERFIKQFAKTFSGTSEYIQPAFEDPVHGLWREASLPVDVDLDEDLATSERRSALLESFEKGSRQPVGYFLPLERKPERAHWVTSSWPLRRSHTFLLPGSSPMGMRLPLDTLPVSEKKKAKPVPERDPSEQLEALPEASFQQNVSAETSEVIRKALVCESREGLLRVFLPPLTHMEHAIDLLAAIEDTAEKTQIPVILEGYSLPSDLRVERLSVTPDPGVVEVNIHPTDTFEEMNSVISGLYEDARNIGLATEKFHLDGRHTGTGGGNHITVGGAHPSQSPLLTNPELLASIVTYWQHHPALSYLFSGLFVGPTSQAPRVDEARLESLHELDIALSEIRDSEHASPWLTDRALRHILTDLTGNTHRAELCIDKLFSPEHARGRLGLLELRAFEMPPHYQMSMVTYLLVRAIISRLWEKPYDRPLIRWGTDLHDRYLLPHYLSEDMSAICQDLSQAGGFRFDPAWFEPFFSFRFPRYGSVISGDLSLELRAAIEPWLVLGEQISDAGTARYVDSSMERLQVKAAGFCEGRHIVTVNGHQVPLRPTGTPGEYVAGVKYRAWHPPSALHPTIGVHTPLVFEIVDTWNEQVVGGARYHVTHPGGRSYDVFPVNALEAESRRQSRFDESTLVQQGALSQASQIDKEYASNMPVTKSLRDASLPVVEPIVSGGSPTILSGSETDKDFPTTLDLRNKS